MNLNCLTCQTLQRTDSEREQREMYNKLCCIRVDRSWSGNLNAPPPPYEQMRNGSIAVTSKNRQIKNHRRLHTTGAIYEDADTPRLVRSAGMRRDWSFEDLRQRNDQKREGGRLS